MTILSKFFAIKKNKSDKKKLNKKTEQIVEKIAGKDEIIQSIKSLKLLSNYDSWGIANKAKFGPLTPHSTMVKEHYPSIEKATEDLVEDIKNSKITWYRYGDEAIYYELKEQWGLDKRFVIIRTQEIPAEYLLYMAWTS